MATARATGLVQRSTAENAGAAASHASLGNGIDDDADSVHQKLALRQGAGEAGLGLPRQVRVQRQSLSLPDPSPAAELAVPFPPSTNVDIHQLLAPGRLPAYRPSSRPPHRRSGRRRVRAASPAPLCSSAWVRVHEHDDAQRDGGRRWQHHGSGAPRTAAVRSARAWRSLLFGKYTRKVALACACALIAAMFLFGLVLLAGRRRDRARRVPREAYDGHYVLVSPDLS